MRFNRCKACGELFTPHPAHANQIHCSTDCAVESRRTIRTGNYKINAVWSVMKSRCNCPDDKSYHNYGGRGITYDPRWEQFENFFQDMGAYYKEGLTLERKDNNGNYCKENCIWTTRTQQSRNKRNNIWIDTPAGKMLLVDAAKKYRIKYHTLKRRLYRGVDLGLVPPKPIKLRRVLT